MEAWSRRFVVKKNKLLHHSHSFAIVRLLEFIVVELLMVPKLYCNAYFVVLCMAKLPLYFVMTREFVNLNGMTMCCYLSIYDFVLLP